MLEKFLCRPCTLEQFRASPVGPHLDRFAAALHEVGFKRQMGASYLRDAVHLGRWATGHGIPIESLDEQAIDGFRSHLKACDCAHVGRGSHGRSANRVCVFLEYLRKAGVAAPAVANAGPPRSPVLYEFEDWLRQQRGATAATIRAYKRWVSGLIDRLGEDPNAYTPQALRAAVVALAAGHSCSTAEQVVTATRVFLRFLAVGGRCSLYLIDGILPVAPRGQAKLPRYLTGEEIDKLIAHCDPETPTGMRDRAILLLLVRLGLRAGDVRALQLGDIDWTDASFRVTGKGRRETRLPLSQEVGDAILAYLEHGRPKAHFEEVFLTVRPPWRPLAEAVSCLVARALRRAGIESRPRGSHLLRHSAATAMLHQGGSLPAIGAVLRHQSVETTTQYARVDARLLRQVAQPWLEVAPC